MVVMREEDIARARAETPGCTRVTHLNNAGAALPPACVTNTVIDHLRAESLGGGYEPADARARVDAVYQSIATLINAAGQDIALTDNSTRAWQSVSTPSRSAPATGS